MNRDALLDSALRTLNERPAATLATIAEDAGISRATLHRHFDSRDALVLELGGRAVDRWERSLDAIESEEVETAVDQLIRRYVADVEIFGFTLTEARLEQVPELAERARELEERERALWATAQRAGLLRDDVSPTWISWTLFGLLVGARDGIRFGDLPSRGLADVLISTFLRGCGR